MVIEEWRRMSSGEKWEARTYKVIKGKFIFEQSYHNRYFPLIFLPIVLSYIKSRRRRRSYFIRPNIAHWGTLQKPWAVVHNFFIFCWKNKELFHWFIETCASICIQPSLFFSTDWTLRGKLSCSLQEYPQPPRTFKSLGCLLFPDCSS